MKKLRISISLGLALAMAVSVAACDSSGSALPSDTTAPIVTESETMPIETEATTELSDSSYKAPEHVFEQVMTDIKTALQQDKDSAKEVIESKLGAKLSFEEADGNEYYYSTDITIEGVQFTQLEIKINKSDEKVFEVNLVNDTSNTTDCKSYVEKYKNKLTSVYGNDLTSSDSSEYEGFKVSVSEGANCIIGGSYSANYNKFYLIFSTESV